MSVENDGEKPTNNLVGALLVDLYQLTMTYAHWKTGKHEESSVFELFFRRNPFGGEFTVFCGLDECLKHIQSFSFSDDDIAYLKTTPSLMDCEESFFDYLRHLDTSGLTVWAMQEGTLAFPREPLIVVEGPLGLGQLLETSLLNLVNFPSLIATNASRMVLRANPAPCIEFGLRRAQGPDGACSASKYSYVGGFAATSNVKAGKLFGIPVAGTHAHSFCQSFISLEEVRELILFNKRAHNSQRLLPSVLEYRDALPTITGENFQTNDGELASFIAYACAFPNATLCLVDTYSTLGSGLPNFAAVAMALDDFGYRPKGVRLDSGDLAGLSMKCAEYFRRIQLATGREAFRDLAIVASNDINEEVLHHLTKQPHKITTFGIGTNLVTCQAQPALGCVYKLVEWEGHPRIKISQDLPKVTIPGRKRVFRIYGQDDRPILDIMLLAEEGIPIIGRRLVCRDPFNAQDRFCVTPKRVVALHSAVYENGLVSLHPDILTSRTFVKTQLQSMLPSVIRYANPDAYDVKVSTSLFHFLHDLWEKEAPMEERR